jgi:iron complex outermembrane receptor protein
MTLAAGAKKTTHRIYVANIAKQMHIAPATNSLKRLMQSYLESKMRHFRNQQTIAHCVHMIRDLVRGASICALAAGASLPALAQSDSARPSGAEGQGEQESGQTIVVTGIRKSLSDARNLKRNTDQFMDAVVATDIGKLPDANIAESLQRVSGVQLDRGIGEGSNISIRGLRNNIILLNGREINDAGGRGSRGPDTIDTGSYSLLSMLPSELVSRLELTKLAGADVIEGGVGGVVNIITARPLDSKGFRASTSVEGKYYNLSSELGGKGSFLVSDTFANDTIGLQLSGTYGKAAIREDGFQTFSGYARLDFLSRLNFTDINASNAVTGPDGQLLNPDPNGDGILGVYHSDPRYWQIDDNKARTGLNFVAQWSPAGSFDLTYDALFSRVESDRERRWLSNTMALSRHTNAVLNKDEVLISGEVDALLLTNVEYGTFTNQIFTHALAADWDVSDRLNVKAELSGNMSKSSYHQNYFRMSNTKRFVTPYDFTPNVPAIGINGDALTDVNSMVMDVVFDTFGANTTDELAFRLDFDQKLIGALSLEYGARYSAIETNFTRTERDVRPGVSATDLQQAGFLELWDSPDFFAGEAPGLTRRYITLNDSVKAGVCTAMKDFFRGNSNPAVVAAFERGRGGTLGCDTSRPDGVNKINDEFMSAYAKLNYDLDLGSVPISGNIGIRYVDRKLTTTGTVNVAGVPKPLVVDVHQSDFLPSFVAKFELTDKLIARVGAARVQAWPNTAAARNDLFVFANGTGRGGSPNLDPFRANQFDMSLEYYFARDSLISVAYFKKKIESFIVSSSDIEQVPEFRHEDGYLTDQALITRQINGNGGTIDGFEVLYQQGFSMLPAPFDGLGAMATYSYIDSSTPFEDPFGANLPIAGLSKHNVNLVAYWEKGPLGMRLAYNWRDQFLTSLGFEGTGIYDDAYADLSFTAYWDVTDRVKVNFEAINLTNERRRQFNTVSSATRSVVEYGPSYALGVSVNF